MVMQLPPHIWFVRANSGSGYRPIRPEGWKLFFRAGIGAALSFAAAIITAIFGLFWLAIVIFVAGAALSAWWFVSMRRKHTDDTITLNDYMRGKRVQR